MENVSGRSDISLKERILSTDHELIHLVFVTNFRAPFIYVRKEEFYMAYFITPNVTGG